MFKLVNQHLFVFAAIVFRLTLDFSYIYLSNSYYGFEFPLHFNPLKSVVSYLLVLLMCYFPYNRRNLSSFFLKIIIFFIMIPLSCIYSMADQNSLFYFSSSFGFVFCEFVVLRVNLLFKGENIFEEDNSFNLRYKQLNAKPTNGAKLVSVLAFLLTILTLLLLYRSNGIPTLDAFDFSKTYEVRGTYKSSKYLDYLITACTAVLVPFGVAEGVLRNRTIEPLFFLMSQILIFMWCGNKMFLFSIVLFLSAIILIHKPDYENYVFLGITAITILGYIFAVSRNNYLYQIFALINKRVLLDSNAIKYFYYDYFIKEGHTSVGFSGTLIAPFLTNASNTDYRLELSKLYLGSVSNANAGLFGGDIAHLGILAFIVVPILLLVWFAFINRTIKWCGSNFALILYIFVIYYLNDRCIFLYSFDFTGFLLIVINVIYKYQFKQEDQLSTQ